MATKEQLRKMREKYHLGEYSNKARKHKAARTRRKASRRHASKGGSMARRRHRSRRRGGLFSGKGLIGGKLGLGGGIVGTLGTVAIGYFLAPKVASMIPVNVPFKGPITGFVLGGPMAAVGAYAAESGIMSNTGSATSATW